MWTVITTDVFNEWLEQQDRRLNLREGLSCIGGTATTRAKFRSAIGGYSLRL